LNDGLVEIIVSIFTGDGKSTVESAVARETPLTIIVNNQEIVTLLCTPSDVNYLAVGFLYSEGFIKNKSDIKKILTEEKRGIARVETRDDIEIATDVLFKRIITSGCGRGASFYNVTDMQTQVKVESQNRISTGDLLELVKVFQKRSETYKITHGVHSAALCNAREILVFNEDVGRHNAVDKIFGECLLKEIPTTGNILITSGRISSEILLKVARRNIPFIVSISAPTDLGVKFADDLELTLVGLAKGKKMTVFTNDWRITSSGTGK
jgi:FdhD protein